MPLAPETYSIKLEEAPECAKRIGIIIGLFAIAERQLIDTFHWLANIDIDVAAVSLGSHGGFSSQLRYVEATMDANQPNWPRGIDEGKLFVSALKKVNTIRNKYAHSIYSLSGPEILHLQVFAGQIGNRTSEERADVAILDEDIAFLKTVIVEMKNYCESKSHHTKFDVSSLKRALSRVETKRPLTL
jgi:hypothetical protein